MMDQRMRRNEKDTDLIKHIGVEALVLAGSTTTGLADEGSDYDLYAYTREPVPLEFRAQLLKPRAARLELHNTFWEWSDEWIEPDGAVCIADHLGLVRRRLEVWLTGKGVL
jgi:predicted nucleotidyltransferase